MDLTPPLEAGCLIEVLKPQTTETGENVTGAWQYVYFLEDGGKFKDKEGFPRKDLEGVIHAIVNDVAKIDSNKYYWCGLPFAENEIKVVKERYHDIWPEDATYKFGSRVFLMINHIHQIASAVEPYSIVEKAMVVLIIMFIGIRKTFTKDVMKNGLKKFHFVHRFIKIIKGQLSAALFLY